MRMTKRICVRVLYSLLSLFASYNFILLACPVFLQPLALLHHSPFPPSFLLLFFFLYTHTHYWFGIWVSGILPSLSHHPYLTSRTPDGPQAGDSTYDLILIHTDSQNSVGRFQHRVCLLSRKMKTAVPIHWRAISRFCVGIRPRRCYRLETALVEAGKTYAHMWK